MCSYHVTDCTQAVENVCTTCIYIIDWLAFPPFLIYESHIHLLKAAMQRADLLIRSNTAFRP